jgi:hypothetical protein
MRRSNAQLQVELNEIYNLIVKGAPHREIMNLRNIKERNFRKYLDKLHNSIVSEALGRRQEYFIEDIAITKDRLLYDKRNLLRIITAVDATHKEKLDAINSDIQLNITLMKLEYEGSMYLHGLNARQQQQQQEANSTPVQLSPVSTN